MEIWRKSEDQAEIPFKVNHQQDHAVEQIASRLSRYFAENGDRERLIVCVGTDRSTGDALGPLVGMKLKALNPPGMTIYGTLEQPVHAMNLEETLETIAVKHHHALVIAIDACLGQLSSVGCIQLCNGPLKPGAGVNKSLPPVGDVHLTGIVNVGGFMEYFVLQNTRLSLVMSLADVIASSIYVAASCDTKKETAFSFEK